jgi:hypothetical protein
VQRQSGNRWHGGVATAPGGPEAGAEAEARVHTAWDSGTRYGRTTRRALQAAIGGFGLRTGGVTFPPAPSAMKPPL